MTARQKLDIDVAGADAAPSVPREVQQQILRAVADIRYGSIEIVIQDGKVVQIESREKQRIRMDKPLGSS